MDKNLTKYLEMVLNDCLNEVALRVEEELKLVIEIYVYNPYEPIQYERTWQFYDSFVSDLSKKLVKMVYHDPSKLKWNANKHQHGSSNTSRTDMMAEILNDAVLNANNSEFGGALNVRTDINNQGYWDAFLDVMDREFNNWCEYEICKLPYGIKKIM